MQKKKVLLITYGNLDHASSRIRAINHFKRLQEEFDVKWMPARGSMDGDSLFSKVLRAVYRRILTMRLWYNILFKHYDIVFIQVLFLPELALKILKKRRVLICYDFDDAVYTYSQNKFDLMMKFSDRVIVATPFLKQHIAPYKKNCVVIFSPVDTEKIAPSYSAQQTFTIGWIGSQWTVRYLKTLGSVFEEMAKIAPFKLLIVGGNIEFKGIEIEYHRWSEDKEMQILKNIDIGIMPLENDGWSKMKGGYKLYLYMAAAKAVIASPYGINTQIVKNGVNGYIAETSADWINAFTKLWNEKDLRLEMGKKNRDAAESLYSYNVCTPQLLDFLKNE